MASSQMAHLQFVAQCESRFRLHCAIRAQNHVPRRILLLIYY